jgi:putative Holliday junction resolvase
MAIFDLLELPAATPRFAPVVGLDLGEKTIGVAVSDASWMIASPLELIRKTKFTDDVKILFKLMASREAGAIVIGLPINMDGTEGTRCQSCRAFARNLLRIKITRQIHRRHQDRQIAPWQERCGMRDEARLATHLH